MRCRASLIFNPVAGQTDPQQDLADLRQLLGSDLALDVRQTTAEIGADRLAREAIEAGTDLVIAAGGDGTVSQTAQAVLNTEIPMGIISRGTANAFATAMDIPTGLQAACRTILTGRVRTVDAASCNGRLMLLLASIGWGAEAIEHADRRVKDRLGMAAYVIAGIEQLRDLDRFEVKIATDSETIEVSASSVAVANAAPATSILAQGPAGVIADDGRLDLTAIAPANPAGVIAAAYTLFHSSLRGDSADREGIGYLRSPQFRIETHPAQKVAVDGDYIGTTPVEVKCIPSALRLLVPTEGTNE